MSNPIGGDRVKQTAEAEHIGPEYTGDNISAKKVANYVWNGTDWERATPAGGSSSVFGCNDISDPYYGYTNPSGEWQIRKVEASGVSYATVLNNGGVADYVTAWSTKATLTYQRYDEAF